jgi:hypothetical protein
VLHTRLDNLLDGHQVAQWTAARLLTAVEEPTTIFQPQTEAVQKPERWNQRGDGQSDQYPLPGANGDLSTGREPSTFTRNRTNGKGILALSGARIRQD